MERKWRTALNKAKKRWDKIIENGGDPPEGDEGCALCEVTGYCNNCPLYLWQGQEGCVTLNMPYRLWELAPLGSTLKQAIKVREALEACGKGK